MLVLSALGYFGWVALSMVMTLIRDVLDEFTTRTEFR